MNLDNIIGKISGFSEAKPIGGLFILTGMGLAVYGAVSAHPDLVSQGKESIGVGLLILFPSVAASAASK